MGCLRGLVTIFVIIIGIGVVGAMLGGGKTSSTATTVVPAAAVSQPAPAPKLPYADRIAEAADTLGKTSFTDGIENVDDVVRALATIDIFATIAAEGAPPESADERKKFIAALSAKQKAALPIIRDKYGPAMRQQLWEADGKAKTFGAGFRTVEFVAGAFAANRNIKSSHETLHPTLMKLRFTRAQYKWIDADVEYTYYKLDAPADGQVGTWYGGYFEPVR